MNKSPHNQRTHPRRHPRERDGIHVKHCLYDDENISRSIISVANEMNLINLCLFIKNTLKALKNKTTKKIFLSSSFATAK